MRKEDEVVPILFENRVPVGGFDVRLPMQLRSFPTATIVKEMANGSIELWNDRIFLEAFAKGTFLNFYPRIGNCKRTRIYWRDLSQFHAR
jgi:hypothetical protein